ncbi:MAG TPA: arginine--tRNA ligase [Mycobacteriales bacterium]|nr:arginine--tRNA ligase [Mycobacteriales bacterium]
MTPTDLGGLVVAAVRAAVAAGELSVEPPDSVVIERPKNRDHGDYATNVALQLARPAGRPPREVADIIATRLREAAGVEAVDVAGPGFLNVSLAPAAQGELARTIVTAGGEYGRSDVLAKQKINLEFVSANPTGPVHLGHTRWAALGDSLRRLLEATGADVTAEHYVNDAGLQMTRFAESLYAAAHGEPRPEDGYAGEYIGDVAAAVIADRPDVMDLARDEAIEVFRQVGYQQMLAAMKADLGSFGVRFDVWFSEASLHDSGAVEHAVDVLREQGHVFEADGAVWLRTTDFGDDKDRVMIRSNGEPTYFAADAAYYINKRERGFDRCVYMLGADHHGYVGRLKAIASCAGDDAESNIEVLIGQLVKLMRDGEEVRLSKRAGSIITLSELVEAVGVDAARYSLARYPADSPLTLDIGLITRQTSDNPVFYVQYAHARLSSLLRNATELGITRGEDLDPALLAEPQEGDLLASLGEFPRVVAGAAELREPHRVARYLEDLAATYHRFYDACRVLPMGDEPATDLTGARLWLVEATRIVLASGLGLLGVSAPERM